MTKPGYNICVGPDPSLLREHIEALLAKHLPTGNAWKRKIFWGDEPLSSIFWDDLILQGLFSEPKAIILRNAQNLPAEQLKKLSAALATCNALVWPFICVEVEQEKGKFKVPAHFARLQCCVFAQKNGWYAEIAPLDKNGLKIFVQKEAKRLGLELQPTVLENILHSLPPDAGAIRLEMEKISLACPDGKLTPEAASMLNFTPELDIFAFLQGVQSGIKPELIWQQLFKDSMTSADSGLFGFSAMLLREARILWQLLAGEQAFLPSFVIKNKTALARSLGFGGLARIWDIALQADKGVKTGEHSPQQAFERLLADLFRLFKK